MLTTVTSSEPISEALIHQYDVAGPRYTSYPTADRFVEAFGASDYVQALAQRVLGIGTKASPLSLYVHIPFCESLCYYCACNKIITKHHDRAKVYLSYLNKELALHAELLGHQQPVSQLHLGGGTPTFLSDDELRELMAMLRRHFKFVAGGECSIEVDPRTIDADRLNTLAELGFNRLSFGVQDFDPAVQKAVHRIQPVEQVFELVRVARELGFESVNVDLIYGLPEQTPASVERTMAQVMALRPDRIALYAYAHLPERFKPQRRIDSQCIPTASSKVSMLAGAMKTFMDGGYVYIGMDHFALPTDALAVAKRLGRLHRNFQGYSTLPDCDLIGLGVSSIGKVGASYCQNVKSLEAYYDSLDRGQFPVERGLALSRDDLIRRSVIMALMCQGDLNFEAIELAYLIDFKTYFARELTVLAQQREQGLVRIHDQGITVTHRGWFFVRAVAMVFDRYLQSTALRSQFSKIL